MSDGAAQEGDADADREEAWREYFAFEEPYANQADAVEAGDPGGQVEGVPRDEGPCGTGRRWPR